ncbi:AraC family transcriptional regulator [Metaclostridioides mangenotii]|uniref:helix-turn-helix domain-containing protein n=1 Tax=Metaclostridioides mangenotii TaxID=1540 RepID=UPI0028EB6C8B|nr:AraC family transcriptional regulator [Clostridioides mangenotii]
MNSETKNNGTLFSISEIDNGNIYKLSPNKGCGFMRELTYHNSLFVSTSELIFNDIVERHLDAFKNNFIEIIYLESGNMSRSQKGYKTIDLKPGINVFVNNHRPMKLLYQADSPLKFVTVTLFSDFYDEYINSKFPEDNIKFLKSINLMPPGYNTPEISLIFKQIKSKMASNINNRIYYESKIGEIISIIVDISNKIKVARDSNKVLSRDDLKSLNVVREVLDKNYVDKPTIDDLAYIAKMSQTKLKSSFKSVYNTTITQYSISVKLRYSLILLADADASIEEIAKSVGYKNASKFSQMFFKTFGMYPKNYRNLYKYY